MTGSQIDTVKVAGVPYDIHLKDVVVEDNIACYGIFDMDKSEICLSNVESDNVVKITLIHELLHAIAYHYGLKFLDDEENVDRLSKALYQVLNDNFSVEIKKEY